MGADAADHRLLTAGHRLPANVHSRWLVLLMMALGALGIILLYQVPARHVVDIGGYDAAYVRGFHDAEDTAGRSVPRPYLVGSNGRARWSRDRSFLLFPQAGLPGQVTLRLRGWRPAESDARPPQITVLLNGRDTLGTLQTTGDWEEHTFAITRGLFKASDLFIELRSETTSSAGDARVVGVLLDQAVYSVSPGSHGFITPYPSQVLYGALFAGLLGQWLTGRMPGAPGQSRRLYSWAGMLCIAAGVLFLVCYRLQPPWYPYPLRWLLPVINLGLAALLVLRYAPTLCLRRPLLLDSLALAIMGIWTGAILWSAQDHLTLSVPGVEKDFRVFAIRAEALDGVFQADGFYNLGYPFLLWLVRPLTAGNAFLAARVVAALSGALFLLVGYSLTRILLAQWVPLQVRQYQRLGGVLALLLLALSPLVVQYGLYVGTDMPFAALTGLALLLLLLAQTRSTHLQARSFSTVLFFVAGLVAGCAFLVRHLGLLLLPWALVFWALVSWTLSASDSAWWQRWRLFLVRGGIFAAGFMLAALPQLVVNMMQTGQPLYNQQAKNVWLAVYGNIDWGRWHEVPDSIELTDVMLRDPPRFLHNWWTNMQAFVGSGAEDTSETGRALQLRLLGWPANWLAVTGLLLWLWQLVCAGQRLYVIRRGQALADAAPAVNGYTLVQAGLLSFSALYVLAVSIAFILPRFFLPLAPIYATAAAALLCWLVTKLEVNQAARRRRGTEATRRGDDEAREGGGAAAKACGGDEARVQRGEFASSLWLVGMLLTAVLWSGFGIGTRYVLQQQPADEVAVVQLVLQTLQPGEQLLVRVPANVPLAKYSALAHRVAPWPDVSDDQAALAQASTEGIAYLLWYEAAGPPALPDPEAARVGIAGAYRLYRLTRGE